jgi:hypothetical protein
MYLGYITEFICNDARSYEYKKKTAYSYYVL